MPARRCTQVKRILCICVGNECLEYMGREREREREKIDFREQV
jgi:hypothetical protein